MGVASSGEPFRPVADDITAREKRKTRHGPGSWLDWRRGADSNRRIEVLQTSPLASWVPRPPLHNKSTHQGRQPELDH